MNQQYIDSLPKHFESTSDKPSVLPPEKSIINNKTLDGIDKDGANQDGKEHYLLTAGVSAVPESSKWSTHFISL